MKAPYLLYNPIPLLNQFTTGAWLLARNAQHAHTLCQQLQTHVIHKSYLALIRGGAKSFLQSMTSRFVVDAKPTSGRMYPTEKEKEWAREERIRRASTSSDPVGRFNGTIDAPLVVSEEGFVSLDNSGIRKREVALTEWKLIGSSVRACH